MITWLVTTWWFVAGHWYLGTAAVAGALIVLSLLGGDKGHTQP